MSNKISQALDVFEEQELRKGRADQDKQQELRLKNALETILSTGHGVLVMKWVLGHCGLNSSLSVADTHRMCVLSGRRDVGLEITKKIRALCPEFLEKLNKESE